MTTTTPHEPPIERQCAIRGLTLHFEPGFVAIYRTTPSGFILDRLLSGCSVVGRRKNKPHDCHPSMIPTRIAWGSAVADINRMHR